MEVLRNLKQIQALNGNHGFIKLAGGGEVSLLLQEAYCKVARLSKLFRQSSELSKVRGPREGGRVRKSGSGIHSPFLIPG